jgi:radical SAM superfamily enzyme YgiQ (UPF0313 family)
MLADSGCAQVLIGLETPDPKAISGVELKTDWKRRRQDSYKQAVRRIQSRGITVNGCFVLGLDGSGPESFERVFEFVRDTGLYEVQITIMTPFPGTPLYRRLEREGRLLEPNAWDRCTLFDVNFKPDSMTVSDLETGFRSLMARLYDPAFIRERRRTFYDQRWRKRRSILKQKENAEL